MATRKWSAFPVQSTVKSTDQFMLLDSTEAVAADRDKRTDVDTLKDYIQQNFTKIVRITATTYSVTSADHDALLILDASIPASTCTITLPAGSTLFKGFRVTIKHANNAIGIQGIILPSSTNQIDYFTQGAIGLNESVTYQLEDATNAANWASIATSGNGQNFEQIRINNATTYTLKEDDNGFHVVFPGSLGAQTLTLPANASVDVRSGFVVYVSNPGTDTLTISSTDTIEGPTFFNGACYLKIYKQVYGTPNLWVIEPYAPADLTAEYVLFGGATGRIDQEIGLRYKKSVRAFTCGSSLNAATGLNSANIGGNDNTVSGANSLTGGYRAQATHEASVMWQYTTNASAAYFASTVGGTVCITTENGIAFETNAPNSQFHMDCNWAVGRSASATSTTTATEVIIGITDTSVARTVTLQTADTVEGRIYIIKDESGGAGTNNITIDTQGSETIDGASSISITVDYGVARVYSDGSNWFTF